MLEKLGAALQLAGLTVVGLGLLRGMAGATSVWGELGAAAVGGGIFTVGWWVGRKAK